MITQCGIWQRAGQIGEAHGPLGLAKHSQLKLVLVELVPKREGLVPTSENNVTFRK